MSDTFAKAYAQVLPCPNGCTSNKKLIINGIVGTMLCIYDGLDNKDPNDYDVSCKCPECNQEFIVKMNISKSEFKLIKKIESGNT